jgi:hypothetical protein
LRALAALEARPDIELSYLTRAFPRTVVAGVVEMLVPGVSLSESSKEAESMGEVEVESRREDPLATAALALPCPFVDAILVGMATSFSSRRASGSLLGRTSMVESSSMSELLDMEEREVLVREVRWVEGLSTASLEDKRISANER